MPNLSDVTKLVAAAFLLLVMCTFLFIYGYDVLHNTPVPDFITQFISVAVGAALSALGYHGGFSIANRSTGDINARDSRGTPGP